LYGERVSDPIRSPQYPLDLLQEEIDILRGKLSEILFSVFETQKMQRTIADLEGVCQGRRKKGDRSRAVWTPDRPPRLPQVRTVPKEDQDKITKIRNGFELPRCSPWGT
jgi:hypothetical protein